MLESGTCQRNLTIFSEYFSEVMKVSYNGSIPRPRVHFPFWREQGRARAVKTTIMALPEASLTLLLFLFTATMVVNGVGAVVSPFSSSCSAETTACFDDEVCDDCMAGRLSTEQQDHMFRECMGNYIQNFSGEGCLKYAMSAEPCCIDAISAHDCLANDVFVGFFLCVFADAFLDLGEEECTIATITCGGTYTPAPYIDSDTSSPPDTGTVAPLSTGSTSARDLDLAPSPTVEGGDESETAPTTLEGVNGKGTVGF